MYTLVPMSTANYGRDDKNRRGHNVYTISEIVGVQGRDRAGRIIDGEVQIPIFMLTPQEREYLARLCAPIFAVVNNRCQRISALEWEITKKKSDEDRIVQALRMAYDLYREWDSPTDAKHIIVRARCIKQIKEELPDIKDDLSNFSQSLKRWSKRQKMTADDSSQEIVDWINEPNDSDDFEEMTKKWTYDLMVHGADAQYMMMIGGLLDSVHMLPGGSVLPLRGRYVGGGTGYVQLMQLVEPKIYFSDEIIYDNYIPISARSYGLIPIEALLNKIAESMLFDKLAAERADGTTPPQKIVAFGGGTGTAVLENLEGEELKLPIDKEEQSRIEHKINEERKNAIVTLTGMGTPMVVDISKADTFGTQSERQDKLIRDIGMVFSASNAEMNLDGSMEFSSQSVANQQERQERERGVYPIVRIIDKTVTKKWIPYRFGPGWKMEHKTSLSDAEKLALDKERLQSGMYDVNTLKEERGEQPYDKEEFNYPQGAQPAQLGESPNNPLFMRGMK